jgi:hypothetical protein
MDSLDNFRERFEALERRTQRVEQRLRWWRGIACGVVMLALLSLALPSGKAADTQPRGMAERMATVEKKLSAMDFDDAANEVVISGANLRIVNGLGATETTNRLGNLIVGYNESRQEIPGCSGVTSEFCTDIRTGSHNIVVGKYHEFSSFGGLAIGEQHRIDGPFASVSGGLNNRAIGEHAAVCGGEGNLASGRGSTVSGGSLNTASNFGASVSGGSENTASINLASVCGGQDNLASGGNSTVCGGFSNTASGLHASVSGGRSNTASGEASSVSGGLNRTAPGQFNWAAGALFSDQ